MARSILPPSIPAERLQFRQQSDTFLIYLPNISTKHDFLKKASDSYERKQNVKLPNKCFVAFLCELYYFCSVTERLLKMATYGRRNKRTEAARRILSALPVPSVPQAKQETAGTGFNGGNAGR